MIVSTIFDKTRSQNDFDAGIYFYRNVFDRCYMMNKQVISNIINGWYQ